MCLVHENNFIENLVKGFARSPKQLNKLQESDAELISLGENITLAITTDSISEEIELGLYDDPYQIGWLTVTASISDLCAVGAKPLGILLSQTFCNGIKQDFISELQRGIAEACIKYETFVLGGDTNFSSKMNMCATAVGMIESSKPLMRKGAVAGDLIYSSGRLGKGNNYAFKKLSGLSVNYNPIARVDILEFIVKYASSCIDSSDGLFAALDQLMHINRLGFQITTSYEDYIDESVISQCLEKKLPPWFMLAGPHGEYELVFTVSAEKENLFMESARLAHWFPIKLGEVTCEPEIKYFKGSGLQTVDTILIRNLFSQSDLDLTYYLTELWKIENNWRMS